MSVDAAIKYAKCWSIQRSKARNGSIYPLRLNFQEPVSGQVVARYIRSARREKLPEFTGYRFYEFYPTGSI